MGRRKLALNNIVTTRKTIARLLRELDTENSGDIDIQKSRLLLEHAKVILACHKAEADLRIEEEIQAIKTRLKDRGIL